MQLCGDLVGLFSQGSSPRINGKSNNIASSYGNIQGSFEAKAAMLVWGEAWDMSCWEVSEEFLGRWKWMFEGCEEEVRRWSEGWKRIRGEEDGLEWEES